MNQRLISARFPYIPIGIQIRHKIGRFEALLDTGFEGALIVPEAFAADIGDPDQFRRFRLADGSETIADDYLGTANLGPLGTFPVTIAALGDECLIGRGLSDRFTIILDHGRQLIVEP